MASYRQAGTVSRAPDSSAADGLARRVARFLITGPAQTRMPAARWAVNLLALAGAALAIWSGVIHLRLWADGYRDISVIGPLFLIQGAGTILLAVALLLFRRLVLVAAGAVALVATAVGLLLSVHIGLFGFRESLAVPYASSSLVVEFVGGGVLAIAAVILAAARRDRA
jgi:hypothetical protein